MNLHYAEDMAAPLPPDARIAALLETLNDLIAEAQYLREEVERTARERQTPLWPERRDHTRRFRERRIDERTRGGRAK